MRPRGTVDDVVELLGLRDQEPIEEVAMRLRRLAVELPCNEILKLGELSWYFARRAQQHLVPLGIHTHTIIVSTCRTRRQIPFAAFSRILPFNQGEHQHAL